MIEFQGEYFYFRSDDIGLLDKQEQRVIRITLTGIIGEEGFLTLTKDVTFTLTLNNPCLDPEIVSLYMPIEEIPTFMDYTIFDPFVQYNLPPVVVETLSQGQDSQDLCGQLQYDVIDVVKGQKLSVISEPIAFFS